MVDLSLGVDLSTLGKSQPAEPPVPAGHFRCTVPDGCGLLMRERDEIKNSHDDLVDCLDTTLQYVTLFFEMQSGVQQIIENSQIREQQVATLYQANISLSDENDRLKADVQRLKQQVRTLDPPTPQSVSDLAESLRKAVTQSTSVPTSTTPQEA